MAGFFDKVSVFAKAAVDQGKVLTQTAVDKGKELSDIAKLNMDITKAKDRIKEAKLSLGEYVLKNELLNDDETASGYINEIKELLAKIESIKTEIDNIKAGKTEKTSDASGEEVFEEAVPVEEEISEEAPVVSTEE